MKNENEKLSKFSEILSKMRKERGVSQKKAAADLGISQALLSHYEKGIRECGLDFVIKCSKYYGVTTDYLLGVSENRNGMSSDVLANITSTDGRSAKALALQDARFVFIEDKSRTGFDEAEFAPLKEMISEAEEYILSNYITL